MTFWRHFRTDPFVGALVLGVLVATWAGSTQAQEPRGEGARSRQGTLLYKSISKELAEQAAARQRAEEQKLEAAAAQPLVAPANDNFAAAIALEDPPDSVSGTNVDATAEPGEPAHAGSGGISSVWYTFTPDDDGITFLDTFGSDFDTVLAVYTGDSVDALTQVAFNDDADGLLQSALAFSADAGTTYRIAVDGFQGAQGNFTLNFDLVDRGPPDNDDFDDAIALPGQQGSVSDDNIEATAEPGEPVHAGSGGVSSVWYSFTPDQSGVTVINTFGSDFDTVLAVYTGDAVDDLTEVASNDDFGGGFQSQVVFFAEVGNTYQIAVDGFEGAQGNFTLNFVRTDLLPPDNDNFDDAIALQGQQGRVSGSNIGATAQPGEPQHAGVGGISSVWYTFTPNQTGVTFLDTFGSDYDTVLAVYTGDTVDDLTEVASNDDAAGLLQSQVVFLAQAGVTYQIAVDGFQGAQGNFVLNFRRTNQQRPANDDFADGIALQGEGSVQGNNLGASAEPGEPVHAIFGDGRSLWYTLTSSQTRVVVLRASSEVSTDDIPILPLLAVYRGLTVDSLTEVASSASDVVDVEGNRFSASVPLAFLAQAGVTYRIAVDTDSFFRPGAFTLAFERGTQLPPDNDDFDDAVTLDGRRGSTTGSSVGATREANEVLLFTGFLGNTRSVWYTITPDRTGIATFDTFGSDFDTVLAVFQGGSILNAFPPLALNDDAGNGRQSEVAFLAESGVTYHIAVDGFDNARGNFTLNFERTNRQSPGNDAFASARRLIGPRGNVSGLNVNATAQPAEPAPTDPGVQGGSSVWWRWRAPFSGEVTFTTAGSTFDTVLAVYQGPSLANLTEIASNNNAVLLNDQVISESVVTFEAEEGQLYHILVDGFGGAQGTISLAFTPGDAVLKRGVEAGKQPPGRQGPKS